MNLEQLKKLNREQLERLYDYGLKVFQNEIKNRNANHATFKKFLEVSNIYHTQTCERMMLLEADEFETRWNVLFEQIDCLRSYTTSYVKEQIDDLAEDMLRSKEV